MNCEAVQEELRHNAYVPSQRQAADKGGTKDVLPTVQEQDRYFLI